MSMRKMIYFQMMLMIVAAVDRSGLSLFQQMCCYAQSVNHDCLMALFYFSAGQGAYAGHAEAHEQRLLFQHSATARARTATMAIPFRSGSTYVSVGDISPAFDKDYTWLLAAQACRLSRPRCRLRRFTPPRCRSRAFRQGHIPTSL